MGRQFVPEVPDVARTWGLDAIPEFSSLRRMTCEPVDPASRYRIDDQGSCPVGVSAGGDS
jgi:hypothetical protein